MLPFANEVAYRTLRERWRNAPVFVFLYGWRDVKILGIHRKRHEVWAANRPCLVNFIIRSIEPSIPFIYPLY